MCISNGPTAQYEKDNVHVAIGSRTTDVSALQNKESEEVMVKPDAHMGDVVEALRQGLLQGMNVELLVKRMYFSKAEDYKREAIFTELTFLQVSLDNTPPPLSPQWRTLNEVELFSL